MRKLWRRLRFWWAHRQVRAAERMVNRAMRDAGLGRRSRRRVLRRFERDGGQALTFLTGVMGDAAKNGRSGRSGH